MPVAALAALLLVAAGFWGGAVVEKDHGSSSAAAAQPQASPLGSGRRATGATGASGATGAGAASGGFSGFGGATSAAAGTISVVDGNTLYVLTAAGALVKVTLGPSTTVTRNAKSQPIDLRPGDTVVVQGATGTNGTVTATSVARRRPA